MISTQLTADKIVTSFHGIFGLTLSDTESTNSFVVPVADIKDKPAEIDKLFERLASDIIDMSYEELFDFYMGVENIINQHGATFYVQRDNGELYGEYSIHPVLKVIEMAALDKRPMQINDELMSQESSDHRLNQEFGGYSNGYYISQFFGDPSSEEEKKQKRKSPSEDFGGYIAEAVKLCEEIDANSISKNDLLADPSVISQTFEKFLKYTEGKMPQVVRGTMIAESICDNVLGDLSLEELLQVYLKYTEGALDADAQHGRSPDVFFHVKSTDYFEIGVREIQSHMKLNPKVSPHLGRGAVMMDGYMVPTDRRIKHLISSTHGGYYTGYVQAMQDAIAGKKPAQSDKPNLRNDG